MADYIEPTKTSFNAAEQVAIDAVTQTAPTLLTKTGSVIRELIIRPVAYLLSWASGNINNSIEKYSVSYLKTSQLTVNPVADLVASNYFVTRQEGIPAKGIVTLTLSTGTWAIAAGAGFSIAGVACITPVQCIIRTSLAGLTDTDNIVYVRAIPTSDGNYMANIPVTTVSPGPIEIPAGSDVILNFSCPYFIDAELTSPITGGRGVETDAELMVRAEYNTAAAGIGSYYGLKKKMSKAPVAVSGLSVIAGEDKPLFRSRYNSVSINPGGYVDCHVKTSNQAITQMVSADLSVTGTTYSIALDGTECPGFIRAAAVYVGGENIQTFSTSYGTNDPLTDANGARLSVNQTASITFTSTAAISGSTADVYLTYMAGIRDLQNYVNKDSEHFVGQDIKVKAAVPVNLRVGCSVKSNDELTEDDLDGIKQAIVDYVNSMEVGTGVINFSDIRSAVLISFPNVDLRLPCVLTGDIMTKDGAIDTIVSNTGIFDIRQLTNTNYWGYQVCFFSSCPDNVRLNVL